MQCVNKYLNVLKILGFYLQPLLCAVVLLLYYPQVLTLRVLKLNCLPKIIVLSKPKLDHQLNSTEFEVRLHSYIVIHHPPHPQKVNLYTQNWTELTTAQLSRRDPLYKCTVTHRPVKQLCTTFSRPNLNFFQTKGF